jgi:hypothetical protein
MQSKYTSGPTPKVTPTETYKFAALLLFRKVLKSVPVSCALITHVLCARTHTSLSVHRLKEVPAYFNLVTVVFDYVGPFVFRS